MLRNMPQGPRSVLKSQGLQRFRGVGGDGLGPQSREIPRDGDAEGDASDEEWAECRDEDVVSSGSKEEDELPAHNRALVRNLLKDRGRDVVDELLHVTDALMIGRDLRIRRPDGPRRFAAT